MSIAESMTTGAPTFENGLCRDNALLAERGLVANSWYPDNYKKQRAQVKAAIAVCKACPLAAKCLTYAIENGEEYGIWGGTTEWQRHELIRVAKGKQPCALDGCSEPRARRSDDKGWRWHCDQHLGGRGPVGGRDNRVEPAEVRDDACRKCINSKVVRAHLEVEIARLARLVSRADSSMRHAARDAYLGDLAAAKANLDEHDALLAAHVSEHEVAS